MRPVLVMLALLLLGACTFDGTGTDTAGVATAEPTAEPGKSLEDGSQRPGGDEPGGQVDPADPVRPDDPADREDPTDPVSPAEARACTTDTRDQIDASVGGQLEAFAEGDFAAALAFATPGFRSQFDPASFEDLITEAFPVPANARDHSTLACQQGSTEAAVLVEVRSDRGTQLLQYLMEMVGDDWLIGGAAPVQAGRGEDGTSI